MEKLRKFVQANQHSTGVTDEMLDEKQKKLDDYKSLKTELEEEQTLLAYMAFVTLCEVYENVSKIDDINGKMKYLAKSATHVEKDKQAIVDEMADVFIYLLQLA